jgi:hypothetical protein
MLHNKKCYYSLIAREYKVMNDVKKELAELKKDMIFLKFGVIIIIIALEVLPYLIGL